MIRIDGVEIKQNHFPDNTLLIRYYPTAKNTQVITWQYESDAELFTIICLKRHLSQLFPNDNICLELAYVPHARMDRVKSLEDVFTLKYFCETINSLNFYRVWILDPHSDVAPALLNNVSVISPVDYIYTAIDESGAEILCFPDAGAEKRYKSILTPRVYPSVYCTKNRDWQTGKILSFSLSNPEMVKGKTILICDDICSRGGTFYYTAKALLEAGAAAVYLYITHCEKTVFDGDMIKSGYVKHIYTTDSIFQKTWENDMITVFGKEFSYEL